MTVAPGQFKFHDSATPALQAGDYVVRLQQDITQGGSATPVDRHLKVTAPRFALAGSDIASVFPPPNAQGAFGTRLAQVVLKRRTLPWERRIDSIDAAPWLALVLLTPTEATFKQGVPVTQVIPASKHAALGISAADGNCDCIETTANVVQAVFPTRAELRWLSHVREVSLLDTELAGSDLDGFFSVVVSSRLPQSGATYGAYLISLEARGDALPVSSGAPTATIGPTEVTPAGTPDVRFPVLAHWSFTCSESGDFETLMRDLHVGSLGTAPGGRPGVTSTGHVAVAHSSRRGEQRAAWYRGPLTPREVERRERPPLFLADQARRIAVDGLEDLSEAAAFELGRLLAMSDPEFLAALMEWRRTAMAEDVAAETFSFVPGLTELGLSEAGRAAAVAALTKLAAPQNPLGARVERKDLSDVLHRDDVIAIADGFGLDPATVKQVLAGTALAPDIELPDVEARAALVDDFDTLVSDPAQLEHLRRALRERVDRIARDAGLDPFQSTFDPAVAPTTIGELFGGTP